MTGRYAPSPTGPLHLGNAFAAYIAWKRARPGRFVIRIEDLDRHRAIPGMAAQHLDDLRWLGLDWDEVLTQSEHLARYQAAVDALLAAGHAYYCTCSRKQLQLSAPHGPSDDPPPYPGTCRGRREKPEGRYSVRFLARPGEVVFTDQLRGPFTQDVAREVGDFIIARADGMFAYQLAVVVDDIHQRITEVVRGGDLLWSTPRQLLLYEAFNAAPPAFAHVPLIVDKDKLSKREPRHLMRSYSAQALRAAFDHVDLGVATVDVARMAL